MRISRRAGLGSAGALVAVVAMGGAAWAAVGDATASFSSPVVVRGGEVTVTGTCAMGDTDPGGLAIFAMSPGATQSTEAVTDFFAGDVESEGGESEVYGTYVVAVPVEAGAGGQWSFTGTVDPGVPAGEYTIAAQCMIAREDPTILGSTTTAGPVVWNQVTVVEASDSTDDGSTSGEAAGEDSSPAASTGGLPRGATDVVLE